MSNISESLEDYLEAIYLLSREIKVVRVKDIMHYFDYKVSSVNSAVKLLCKKGLVEHEKYGHIELTVTGQKLAEQIYYRHESLFNFFHNILGVEKDIAKRDACKVEHNLSRETCIRLMGFIKYVKNTCDIAEILKYLHEISSEATLNKKEIHKQ